MYVCKIDKIAKMDKTLAREDKTLVKTIKFVKVL